MPTALIADDEPHLLRHLASLLATLWPDLQIVAQCRNGPEAAEQIEALQPDLAFLDIRMPGLTGLEVAQGIECATRVVFVTAYDEFALQAFDAAALDYLVKPVTTERLARSVARLKEAIGHTTPEDPRLAQALGRLQAPAASAAPLRWVRASQGDWTQQIAVEEVLFFRADEKYTCVQTAEREYLIRTPIAELAQQLDPQQFWQIHRSTLINLRFLEGSRRDELSRVRVRLRGFDTELPVSRAYVHLFKAM
ncbi:response regulator transcription factor [Ideonella sp. 4Y16]|uniref:Response regulator transcription factor n=1 Tax=Ideonella alba TaxID=2824118 RepID=A0A940Y7L2_9BURK|nr:LytTR family DNA-binding domain-containing protein [Ideonella alba]MBQ0931554.1 response regulator transcription factor [Ideonella alba]MBQ0943860.1 response regulator transcription factor [Ideonella alba]